MILLVNQLTIPVFADVANAIASSGHQVTLFTGKIEESHIPLRNDVKIVRSFAYRRKSLLTRFFSWLFFTVHLLIYLLPKRAISHILVVTNPPLAPIVISRLAALRSIKYSVLVYDLYPEALAQTGLSSNSNLLFRSWQKINPSVFNNAKNVITLSESMKIALGAYVSKQDSIRVIPNWVETSYIKPIPKPENKFILRHELAGKFVVMYSGNMGLTHDLESLMHAASILKINPEIVFVMVGDGAKLTKLLDIKEAGELTNVLFLPYQDAEDFPLSMAAADVGVITLGVGAEGISVPSKTYVNMAAGLCLLTISPKGSELNRLVEQYNCGFICEPNQPERIVSFLVNTLQNPESLALYKSNARKAALHFGAENAFRYVELVS